MDIKTFVFFDLETTGLIQGSVMPKITEMALIAVSRESICKAVPPRILHKLVIPINPKKMIHPKAEQITKLYNEDVQQLQPFTDELHMVIMYFLQRLTPPICFAAHNGNTFDFPIFLEELKCINKFLDENILCIDTWKMFQDYYKKPKKVGGCFKEPEIVQDLLNDEFNDSLSNLDMDVTIRENRVKVVATTSAMSSCTNKYIQSINNEKIEYFNEMEIQSSKNSVQEANENTPERQIIKPENVIAQTPVKNPKRKLNYACKTPSNLKLDTIYQSMYNSKIEDIHSAEADCLAMIHCIIKIADYFLDWSSNHAMPLSYFRKM